MSSWTRAIVIPLSIVHAANPQRPVPAGFNFEELFLPGAPMLPERDLEIVQLAQLLSCDSTRFLKIWERWGPRFVRKYAMRKCAEWMIEHFERSDGLGAIYPSMQYAIMALDVLGYGPDHPLRRRSGKEFNKLMVDDERGFYMQPCFSPVWDTAIAAFALGRNREPAAACADAEPRIG